MWLALALLVLLLVAPSAAATPTLALGLDDHAQLGGVPPVELLAVAAGGEHALGLSADGRVWSWGGGRDGQIGDGTDRRDDRPRATTVGALSGVLGIAAGYSHSLAVGRDGAVWSWGDDSYGQLGYAAPERCEGVILCGTRPRPVEAVAEAVAVAAGFHHSLALGRDGSVWAWGGGAQGQLGDGWLAESAAPRLARLPVAAMQIAAGGSQSLALGRDGSVWAWGAVDARRTYLPLPTRVEGLPPARAVVAGEHHALALDADGRVWAWGDAQYAQLGDGVHPGHPTPELVPDLPTIVAIAAGTNHNAALDASGAVWVWGGDDDGIWDVATHPERRGPSQLSARPLVRGLGAGPQQLYLLRAD